MAALGAMAATVVHELRTLWPIIGGYARKSGLHAPRDEEFRDDLDVIRDDGAAGRRRGPPALLRAAQTAPAQARPAAYNH
jgi:hypothetical protein